MIDLKDIQRLKSLRILLIGDSCVDHYHYGVCERMSPEAPVPIFKVLDTYKSGGMAHNVKANLEGMGISVYLLTNDEEIIKSRYIDKKTRQHLLRTDWGEAKKIVPLKPKELDSIDFDLFDVVVISDYDKGFLDRSTIDQILRLSGSKPVFVDTKKRDISCYTNCIIKINENELENLTKSPDLCDIIVTLGEYGAMYNNEIFPTKKVEIFDVCGAGDTFLVGLLCAYMVTHDIRKSIKFANSCGLLAVQKFGTYTLAPGDLDDICL